MNSLTFNQMRAAAEAILFAAGEPVEISRIAQALDIEIEDAALVLQSCAEQLDERELGRAIDRFLDTLSRENRVLFLRRYWFGEDIPTLAREFLLSENALSVRLYRIRTQLKQHLIKEGFL